MPSEALLAWTSYDAVLFDLDGVVTPTAEIHERAWAELFADYDYTPADYLAYIDGKPRYDGVASFLESRDVQLPWGDPSDAPGSDTVCAMGNRKNGNFNEILARDHIAPYPGTVEVIELLDRHEVAQAIVSSSKNARSVLAAAGMGDQFETVVDGVTAVDEHLAGKPAPDMFLLAARRLGISPGRCVVVEDAVAGVAAGVAGGFGYVLGVDRGGNRKSLDEAGATAVVDDLGETLT
ncbi:MAG: beta-phosphoglucomutase family hydrolase [Actinomycetia bacterium]|nr:beta-phosphoglucomutase family hydrolase [Actinomycetes bacterium]